MGFNSAFKGLILPDFHLGHNDFLSKSCMLSKVF